MKVDTETKQLTSKIEAYTTKIENEIKALNAKLEAYTSKVESEIKQLKDKDEEYAKFCNQHIQQRENPSDKLYIFEKENLIKERDYHIQREKECSMIEENLNKQIEAMNNKNKIKRKFLWNGKEYDTEAARDLVIHREIIKHQILSQDTESDDE
jgi:hypothetical protein